MPERSDGLAVTGPVADHEIDALVPIIRGVIEPLSYYNDLAIRAELAKYGADALRRMIADDSQAVIIARDPAGPVGFCISRFDDGTIWLAWFATAAPARGRGIGSALLAALKATLPARGAHKIWCDSRTDNRESNAVLERAGFRRIATLTNHWYGQDYFLWEWYP